jgi:error-prone DNA polymerase
MSRRRSKEAMEAYRDQFMAGAAERGVAQGVAERVFDYLLGFAEFGFPKSHGVAFALLAYQSTWLKRYYAPEFMCALFNEQPMGFYPPHVLTNDAKRHGVEVRRPDINVSEARCSVEEDALRVGLGFVKHVGEVGGRRIEDERVYGGAYRSLFDFVQRTGVPRSAIEALIEVGAFDALGLNRRELLWQLGLFGGGMQRSMLKAPIDRQLRLPLPTVQDEVSLPDFDAYQRMALEYSKLSLSPDSHPMQFLRHTLGEGVVSTRHVQTMRGGSTVDLAGLVVCRQQPLTARGIVFLLLEDEFGMTNVLVSRELLAQQREVVRLAPFVRVTGTVEQRGGEQTTVVATRLTQLVPPRALAMPGGKSWV